MKDEKQMEYLLKKVLSSTVEPDEQVNQRIMNQLKENETMKKKSFKKVSMALAATAAVLVLSVTAYAASKLLQPKEVASQLQDTKLAKAFEGQDAVKMNETKTDGDYEISLLGITSGEKLSDFARYANEVEVTDQTYAVVAISRIDGTPMPSTSDESYGMQPFFVSPLIKGLRPWNYNIASMNGGYSELTVDGIMYRLISCDNIEIFADKGLYLCVSSTNFYDVNAYSYNEETGEIAPKQEFDGVNVLFELPIDKSKGNPEKADAYVKEMEASWNAGDEEENGEEKNNKEGNDEDKNMEGNDIEGNDIEGNDVEGNNAETQEQEGQLIVVE